LNSTGVGETTKGKWETIIRVLVLEFDWGWGNY